MKSLFPSSRELKRLAAFARDKGIDISVHPNGRIDIFGATKPAAEDDVDAALEAWENGPDRRA